MWNVVLTPNNASPRSFSRTHTCDGKLVQLHHQTALLAEWQRLATFVCFRSEEYAYRAASSVPGTIVHPYAVAVRCVLNVRERRKQIALRAEVEPGAEIYLRSLPER